MKRLLLYYFILLKWAFSRKRLKLILVRIARKPSYTIGRLYVNGVYFCDTMEDFDRGLRKDMPLDEIQAIKVMHETAIPMGKYPVVVNLSPSKQIRLPRILNVPGFEGILIHSGKDENDTSGCILLGENKVTGKVVNSSVYENRLSGIIEKAGSAVIEIF
jgi:hypothetical protein